MRESSYKLSILWIVANVGIVTWSTAAQTLLDCNFKVSTKRWYFSKQVWTYNIAYIILSSASYMPSIVGGLEF